MARRSVRTEVKQDRVVAELARVAFSDMRDYAVWQDGKAQLRPSAEVDGAVVSDISQSAAGVRIKLHDKLRALEMLARHLGVLKDPEMNVTVNIDLGDRIKRSRERVLHGGDKTDGGDAGGNTADR